MPKKFTDKRTFGEWFFGKDKKKRGRKKQTSKKLSTKQVTKKSATTKKTVVRTHTHSKQDDVKDYISKTIDRLPKELGAKEAKQEVATLSPELARKHEELKRKHLKIGVVAFTVLIGIVWLWNMIISMDQFATTSSHSIDAWQQKAGEINQQVYETFEQQTK